MDHKTFIKKVSDSSGLDRDTCEALLESLVTVLADTISEGESISIPSFGNFESRKRKERIMSHPSLKGRRLLVPPKLVINFKPSTLLRNKINE
ncbi:MAG: HU family DNA-binding protein [Muribaculaceae bacterium]|nr:HU family DNA-binding protein [Muribaculaceae bacterium]